jgi:rod shape-determining protein MreC
MMPAEPRRSRAVVGLLVLASLTVLTLDASHRSSSRSPVDPLRSAVAAVLGPVEHGTTAAFTPLTDIPGYFRGVDELRRRNDSLQAANHALVQRLRLAEAVQAPRNAEIRGISRFADVSHFSLVAAQVVALGPAQSFSRTVTIDAGTSSGVVPDLTVVNADGLVGRVIAATRSSATVLLIIDSKSTVGGRLGDSMELGFLSGDGDLSATGSLQLSLVDHKVSAQVGDTIVSWGSHGGVPYVAGVPIGQVVDVRSSPAELTQTATIRPFVDFSSLDLVSVVTSSRPAGTDLAQGSAP